MRTGTECVEPSTGASREWNGGRWNLYSNFVEANKEVDVRNSCGRGRTKTVWEMTDANARDDAHYDQIHAQKI